MNSSSHRYLSCWPRNTTTARLQATILTSCTKGQQRRGSSGTKTTLAPAGLILVTPQVTLPLLPRAKRQNIAIEGGKSSIFVDDARNVYAPKPPAEDTYLRFEEYGGTGRPRRSTGKSQKGLNVETLVVADAKMVEKHGKGDVTTYILTVMNMVSSLFKDGTIGSDINIVVVSLILLEQEPGGLLINHHADQSLNSFCQWQSALVGKNGKRHDHAILLTGFDICSWKNEPCDTLGMMAATDICNGSEKPGTDSAQPMSEASDVTLENGAFVIVNVICPCDLGMFVFPALEKDQERTGKYIPHLDSKATRFAPISGMCSKYRSCTINEDTGLGLAFTIAHESGHNFGMVHDGEGNPCRKAEGNIMSPTLTGNNGVFSWSSCSRQYLKKFLSTPQAGCLVDEPKQTGQYKYPDKLPGQIYDADTQCKWQFGAKAKLCSLGVMKDICKSLWCHRVGHRCETKFTPAAEGTACGLSMWCRQGQCVKLGDLGPRPIHGQWSAWSKWSECSRTCGGGVKYQERHCSNPKPQYGGKFCPGSSRIYKLCNINPCNENSLDFRAQQCAEYNNKPFRGWLYRWRPYTKVEEEDRCKLYCKAENFEFFFAMSGKVKDGTPCSPHRNDVCIDGICEPVGCDHELGSKAVSDACGVCKGDNSTCKFYKGLYLSQHKANEYYPVVTIPAGARSIEVQELQLSSSYLAVRSLSQKYYLTGGWNIDWPGDFTFAGTTFEYQRSYNRPERLFAPGPTNETLVIEILTQGKNPGISWKYTLPKVMNVTQPPAKRFHHTWRTEQSDCSVSCGGGYISIKAICLRDQKTQVNSSFCSVRTKPATEPKICNAFSCPAYWLPGEWSVCSKSCAGGQQSRKIQCVQKKPFQKEEAVLHSLCPVSTPTQVQVCNSQACPPEWSPGPWSQCSKTCGRGVRRREVLCKNSAEETVSESLCSGSPRPESQEGCVLGRCPKNNRLQWVTSSWSEFLIPDEQGFLFKSQRGEGHFKSPAFDVLICNKRDLAAALVDIVWTHSSADLTVEPLSLLSGLLVFCYLWFGCEEERTDMQREDLAGETDTIPRAEMPQLEKAKPGTGRNLQQKGLPSVRHGGRVVFITMATGSGAKRKVPKVSLHSVSQVPGSYLREPAIHNCCYHQTKCPPHSKEGTAHSRHADLPQLHLLAYMELKGPDVGFW
ncbi:A disintegrin and metalloproteinase with thrombospondin motifs 18 [Microtus ochrogaster]|uniref:A disintegrin and metalloproteinase with thrombospondin motifs 18 n=1 Tax=Microtus ochrogaster TaxID=79684 RepID=A0A8J6L407_MICOH|nr:A disintegrin and metalloproteinase with thrombospondin motifs 18 [Microtus ochrogaster]